jgi:hypothetical protein
VSAHAFLSVLFFYSLIGNFCYYGVSFSDIRHQTTQDYKGFYLSQDAVVLVFLTLFFLLQKWQIKLLSLEAIVRE